MRSDEIGLTARADPLIRSFGAWYNKKHSQEHLAKVARNKLREVARLIMAARKYPTYCNFELFDLLKPEHFQMPVLASHDISGYNENTNKYKPGSLAMHMGTTLKRLTSLAYSCLQQKRFTFCTAITDDTLLQARRKELKSFIGPVEE